MREPHPLQAPLRPAPEHPAPLQQRRPFAAKRQTPPGLLLPPGLLRVLLVRSLVAQPAEPRGPLPRVLPSCPRTRTSLARPRHLFSLVSPLVHSITTIVLGIVGINVIDVIRHEDGSPATSTSPPEARSSTASATSAHSAGTCPSPTLPRQLLSPTLTCNFESPALDSRLSTLSPRTTTLKPETLRPLNPVPVQQQARCTQVSLSLSHVKFPFISRFLSHRDCLGEVEGVGGRRAEVEALALRCALLACALLQLGPHRVQLSRHRIHALLRLAPHTPPSPAAAAPVSKSAAAAASVSASSLERRYILVLRARQPHTHTHTHRLSLSSHRLCP